MNSKVAFVLALGGLAAASQANLIVNPGFEDVAVPFASGTAYGAGNNIGGWLVVGPGCSVVHTAYSEVNLGINQFNAHGGAQYLDLTGPGNQGTATGVTQSFATTAGTTYLVSWWECVCYSANGSPAYSTASVVDLSINGGARTPYTTTSTSPRGQNLWQQFSTSFVASGASSSVTFYCGDGSLTNNNMGIDDISVTAVPEPSTVAAMVVGLGLVVRRRRR